MKSILYPANLSGPAVLYGEKNEKVVIQLVKNKTGKAVERSRLFIDYNNCFLAASPGGKVLYLLLVHFVYSLFNRACRGNALRRGKVSA